MILKAFAITIFIDPARRGDCGRVVAASSEETALDALKVDYQAIMGRRFHELDNKDYSIAHVPDWDFIAAEHQIPVLIGSWEFGFQRDEICRKRLPESYLREIFRDKPVLEGPRK
jgi:hypothetical protein